MAEARPQAWVRSWGQGSSQLAGPRVPPPRMQSCEEVSALTHLQPSQCPHLSCWGRCGGHLQAAFNYEPINMKCAWRGGLWAASPTPAALLPASALRKIGFCVVHFLSPVHVGWGDRGAWAADNFSFPAVGCSTEMGCVVALDSLLFSQGDPPSQRSALGSFSLLRQNDMPRVSPG